MWVAAPRLLALILCGSGRAGLPTSEWCPVEEQGQGREPRARPLAGLAHSPALFSPGRLVSPLRVTGQTDRDQILRGSAPGLPPLPKQNSSHGPSKPSWKREQHGNRDAVEANQRNPSSGGMTTVTQTCLSEMKS